MTDAQWWASSPVVAPRDDSEGDWWKASPVVGEAAPSDRKPNTVIDMAKSFFAGIGKGGVGLLGMADAGMHPFRTVYNGVAGATGLPGAPGGGDLVAAQDLAFSLALPKDQRAQFLEQRQMQRLGSLQATSGEIASQIPGVNYEPQTTAGRYSGAVGEFVPGVLIPGAEAEGLVTSATRALVGGVGSEGARDLTKAAGGGEGAQALAATVGGFLGGVSPEIGAALGGRAATVAGPVGAAISPAAAERQASATLQRRASNPADALKALDREGEIVPGSGPTTFQQTGDLGLGGLEREVSGRNPAAFAQRAADQNEARVSALSGLEPGGNPNDLASALKAQFDDLDARALADIEKATAQAQEKAAGVAGAATAEEQGQAIRSAVEDAERAMRAREGALWDAVDPDASLTANVAQTIGAARDITGQIAKTAKPLGGEEAAIFQAASDLQPLSPARDLVELRARVSDEMRNELKTNGRTRTYSRLSQLRGAIQDNLATTAAHKVAVDDQAVAAGTLQPQEAARARLQQWWEQLSPEAASGANAGRVSAVQARGATDAVPGPAGTGGAAGGRPGTAARDQSLPANLGSAAEDVGALRAGQRGDIFQAIRSLGGMKRRNSSGGALLGPDMDAALQDFRPPPGVINKDGMTPELMADALAQRGWFGPNPTDHVQAFEEAVSRQAQGQRVFHPEDYAPGHGANLRALDQELTEAGVTRWDNAAESARKLATYRAAASDLRRRAEALGVNPDRPHRDVLGDVAEREAIQAESPPAPDPHGEEFDRLASAGLKPTFDEAAADRLAAATEATKARARQFGLNPIAAIMRKAGASDLYDLPAGAVPGKLFRAGPSGYTDAQALIKAVGEGKARPLLEDAAAMTLRRAALREDGTIDPRKFTAWRKAHSDALRALPKETQARFADASKASAAVAEAVKSRAAALKEAQAGAIGEIMGLSTPEDVTRAVGRLLNGRTPGADMMALVKATTNNPMARQGLRRAVADYITGRLIGTSEAGASGVSLIDAKAYQAFIKNARPALNLVFKPDEIRLMEAVARDIQRSSRSKAAFSGGGAKALPAAHSILDVIGGALGATAGFHFGGLGAAYGGAAGVAVTKALGKALEGLHAVGVARVDDLITTAMLHPSVARKLLAKAPAKPPPNLWRPLVASVTAAALDEPPVSEIKKGPPQ